MPIKVRPSVRLFFPFLSLYKHLTVTDILNGCSRDLVTEDFTENYKADSLRLWLVILGFAYLVWSDLAATLHNELRAFLCVS
jgi:hypothetical protein